MGDLHASLAKSTGLEGDPLDKTTVEYEQTGKAEYDQFFVDAAKTQAGLVVSNALVEALTKNIKSFAMSYAAANATDESVRLLLAGRTPDKINADESLALLKLKKTHGGLSNDESKYALRTGANTLQTATYLAESVKGTQGLIEKGRSLSGKVQNDFTGLDAVKGPGVATALTASVNNLTGAITTAPDVAKQLVRLGQGLMSL
jgi:hypothetical protein